MVVSVLDDGIEGEHPDLRPNYVSALGWGRCSREGDINHKQFGRALCVRARSGDRYCGQRFRAKGFWKGRPTVLVWTLSV